MCLTAAEPPVAVQGDVGPAQQAHVPGRRLLRAIHQELTQPAHTATQVRYSTLVCHHGCKKCERVSYVFSSLVCLHGYNLKYDV